MALLSKIFIGLAILIFGWVIGVFCAGNAMTNFGAVLYLNNTDPEAEFLTLKFVGDVDRDLFDKNSMIVKIDRSRYAESQEKQGV